MNIGNRILLLLVLCALLASCAPAQNYLEHRYVIKEDGMVNIYCEEFDVSNRVASKCENYTGKYKTVYVSVAATVLDRGAK